MPRTPPDMQTGGKPSTSSRSDNTVPKQQPQGAPAQPQESAAPRQPHERDESSDSQGSAAQGAPSQAAKDVKNGLVDTSKGKETDETYRKQKSEKG